MHRVRAAPLPTPVTDRDKKVVGAVMACIGCAGALRWDGILGIAWALVCGWGLGMFLVHRNKID